MIRKLEIENALAKKNCLYIGKKDGNNIYIGKSDDKIDMGLASIINNYPEKDKLKFVFIRESEGVYQFGSKRVYIKIGHNGQILVKVGGGFLTVKEFIDKFTPQELEKQYRRADANQRVSSKLHI